MSLPPARALVAATLLVVGVGGAWAATKDAAELVKIEYEELPAVASIFFSTKV